MRRALVWLVLSTLVALATPAVAATLYVTNTKSASISIIDTNKSNKIVAIDTEDDKIVATIPQRGYPDLVTMEPSGRYALVTNRHADLVAVIDLKSHKEVRTIAVGKAPHGMALRPH
jgi:YVTN family beta-propeller protein